MTYPPNAGPHLPGPPGPYIAPPLAPPKRTWIPWVVGGVVALFLICCGGFVAIGVLAPAPEPDQPAAEAPPATSRAIAAAPTTAPPATTPAPTAPATAVMPKVVGLNAAVAVDRLVKAGFVRENIRLGSRDAYDTWVLLPENWTVTKQSEKPGAKVALDAVIALTCTKQQ